MSMLQSPNAPLELACSRRQLAP